MGPPLRTEDFASGFFVKNLMTGAMEKIGDDGIACVDVRDVALAHLKAIQVPAAANKRFLLVESSPEFKDYAQPIIDKYVPLGWPVT